MTCSCDIVTIEHLIAHALSMPLIFDLVHAHLCGWTVNLDVFVQHRCNWIVWWLVHELVRVGLLVHTMCCDPATTVSWGVVLITTNWLLLLCYCNSKLGISIQPNFYMNSILSLWVREEGISPFSLLLCLQNNQLINCNFKGTIDLTISQLVFSFGLCLKTIKHVAWTTVTAIQRKAGNLCNVLLLGLTTSKAHVHACDVHRRHLPWAVKSWTLPLYGF
jgi:hypothetical protein